MSQPQNLMPLPAQAAPLLPPSSPPDAHPRTTASAEPTSLETFSRAKVEATQAFQEHARMLQAVEQFLAESVAYDELSEPVRHVSVAVGLPEQRAETRAMGERAQLITEAVIRNYMKVVFIGRTSSGKSSTINAMLHARVLPSGSGHTTNCFCQVQGTPEAKPYLVAPASPDRRPISDVDHLADALSRSERLDPDAIVDLFWPTANCTLLRHDVVFIDSPGLDISHDTDRWIDRHCTDADVFVLVSNFESSLSRTEVAFFQRVVAKLCKPNIFVLFNRWDAFDEEENQGKDVPGQHMRSAENFLVHELQLQSVPQLAQRVFFVSAKEALHRRTRRAKEPSAQMDTRYREFERFESSFEECISRSALVTRFKKHVESGQQMCTQVEGYLEDVLQRLDGFAAAMTECVAGHRRVLEKLESGWHSVDTRASEIVEVARAVAHSSIITAVANEADAGLRRAISAFTHPAFKEGRLEEFKDRLDQHLDTQLRDTLNARFREVAATVYRSQLQELFSAAHEVLPRSLNLQPTQPTYETTLSVHCASLTQGFSPPMGFSFSLSLERLAPQLYSAISDVKVLNPKNWASIIRSSDQRQAAVLDILRVSFVFANNPFVVAVTFPLYWIVKRHYRLGLCLMGIYSSVYLFEYVQYSTTDHEDEYKTKYLDRLKSELHKHLQGSAGNTALGIEESLRANHAMLSSTAERKAASLREEISAGLDRQSLLQAARAKALKLRDSAQSALSGFRNFMEKYIIPAENRSW